MKLAESLPESLKKIGRDAAELLRKRKRKSMKKRSASITYESMSEDSISGVLY
jgi:hypothetical protein